MIGISLGSLNTCIGVIKNNNVDIILSETSQRCIPTLVAFTDRERLYADSANFSIKSNYLNTINYPTRYLGLNYDAPYIQEELKFALCPVGTNDNNEIVFEFEYNKEKDKYSPEAVMGVFFDKLKQNWFKAGYNTKDIVLSVPDYYTAHERSALLESAKIADLNCTSLVNESSAIAINYGLFRRNQFDDNTPRIVGFVDMGNCKTTVFFASFTKKNHKVISVTSDRNCGSRDMDYLLMQHYAGKFKEKYGCDPMKSAKTRLRMLDVIAKCRKVLTGNKETSLNIDSLMEDEDMHYNVTRDEFESISSPVIKKFKEILNAALSEAKLKPSDLHSVEMVGDAIRIPILQQSIKEIYGIELSKTLTPDECVARGASLYAAMNSPFFSLKDFNFEHCNNYSIIFEYPFMKSENLEIRKTKLILKNEVFPSRKSIKFTEKQIPKNNVLDMKFNYSLEELPYLKQSLLKNYMVSIPNVQEDQYTLAMEFYLDQNGLFSLDKAVLIVTYYEDKVITASSTTTKDPSKEATANSQDAGKDTTMETEKPAEKKEDEKKVEKVKKERKTNCLIKLVSCAYGHDSSTMANWIQREANQEREDLTLKYCKDKRNEIETFIYTTKEKLNHELQPYADQSEKASILKILQDTETWLYNNHEETLNKNTIENIYNQTVTPGQKIYKRRSDWEGLEQALNYLNNGLTSNSNRYDKQYNLSKEGKSILKEKDLQEISKLIQYYYDVYNKTVEKIKNIPRFVDCPVNHTEISKGEAELEDKINRVFVEAEKKSMQENKKQETSQQPSSEDGTSGPNISDKNNKKDKDKMNLD